MTHVLLTISTLTIRFRLQVVLLAGLGIVSGGLLMSAYVGALHDSLQRGEALREMQRSGPALASRVHGASPPGRSTITQVALQR